MLYVLLFAGLTCLILGAEFLIRNATALASAFGITPLTIGLTVVALGTSAPEIAVSLNAALTGYGSIALGNVAGSNIFNILFILGVSALIVPLTVSQQLIRLEVPVMIIVTLAVVILSLNQIISRLEGVFLTTGIIFYTGWAIRSSRKESDIVKREYENAIQGSSKKEPAGYQWLKIGAGIVFGLTLLVVGSRWFVDGAVELAHILGLSDTVIGLTIIAAGTSLPEVATSVMAAVKKERDIAIGNVVGSNIFNLLLILGLSASVSPTGLSVPASMLQLDLWVMLGTAVICFPIFFSGYVISRIEGVLLLLLYIGYITILIV
jgi:cation:H+ antiporter